MNIEQGPDSPYSQTEAPQPIFQSMLAASETWQERFVSWLLRWTSNAFVIMEKSRSKPLPKALSLSCSRHVMCH